MYDIEELREALIDYYGTAMFNASPLAIFDLEKVKRMTDEEIIKEAIKVGLI